MNCETTKTNIPSILAEELPEHERKRMLLHIEECSQCRKEVAELEKSWKLMDQWESEAPSARIKSRLMAAAQQELSGARVPWWAALRKSFIFQTVLSALGLSLIIYLIFPYARVVELCETNILNNGVLAYFQKDLIYFALRLIYGVVPVSISVICCSRCVQGRPGLKGLGVGFIFAVFLVPFFIIQCPQFATGLIITMALGIVAGSFSGGVGAFWLLSKLKQEACSTAGI